MSTFNLLVWNHFFYWHQSTSVVWRKWSRLTIQWCRAYRCPVSCFKWLILGRTGFTWDILTTKCPVSSPPLGVEQYSSSCSRSILTTTILVTNIAEDRANHNTQPTTGPNKLYTSYTYEHITTCV